MMELFVIALTIEHFSEKDSAMEIYLWTFRKLRAST